MFHIERYGKYKNQIVLLGQVDSLYTSTTLSHIQDEDEGRRRMNDNSKMHTTLFDPPTNSWWSIYNAISFEPLYPVEIPCNYVTRLETDGLKFPYIEMGIPHHVWQHIAGMFVTARI